MQIEKKMLSSRQFLCMAFIGGMVIKMFMLPSLLAQSCGRDGVFVMLFYLVLEIINLTIIAVIIKKYPNITFYKMMEDCFGAILSRVIIALFIGAAMLKFTLNLSEIKAFFATSMFEHVKWEIMIIPLLALCVAIGVKSLRVIGRCAEIFLPILVISMIMLALIIFASAPIENALPLLSEGWTPVIVGVTRFPMWFGDVVILVVAMGNTKIESKFVMKAVVVRFVVAIVVLLFSVVLFATYGNIPNVIGYGHNVTSLTQYSLGSQEFGRFDLIIYSLWLLGVFLKVAMNFYFSVRCAAFVINKNCYFPISVAVALVAYVLSVFVFPTQSDVFALSTGWVRFVFCVMEYLTPAALLIASTIRYRKKREKARADYAGQKA